MYEYMHLDMTEIEDLKLRDRTCNSMAEFGWVLFQVIDDLYIFVKQIDNSFKLKGKKYNEI